MGWSSMGKRGSLPLVAMRWMIVSEWRTYPSRTVIAVLAIALGVALGFAVHLINGSALSEFDHAIQTVSGDADLQLHATSAAGFSETLYPQLARVSGVAKVSPVVELHAQAQGHAALTILGLDVLSAAVVTPRLLGRRSDGRHDPDDFFSESAIFLSAAAMQASGRRVGQSIDVTSMGHSASFRIIGDLPGIPAGQAIGVMDIAAAQWRFGQLGKLQRLDFRLAPNANRAQLSSALAVRLPLGAEIVTRHNEETRSDSLSRAYRVNLDMLALMALLTGGFIVYSAQSLSVARRRPQFALIRVLGLERRSLVTQIFLEALVVGAVGALAGLLVGLGLAAAALHLLGSDLGGGYFSGGVPRLSFAPGAAVAFGALGVAASLVGGLLPARDTARSQPALALKNLGDAIDPRVHPRIRLALLFMVLGAAGSLAPAMNGLPIFGYASMALLLAGGIAMMPWLARTLLWIFLRRPISNVSLSLAIQRLSGAPSQAALALSGIVASTSLMIAMAVMVVSFRGSVEAWLYQVLPADLYLALDDSGVGGGFDAVTQNNMRHVDGVAWMGFMKETPLRLAPDKPDVWLIARTVDGPAGGLPLLSPGLAVPLNDIPVWVSEPAAGIYGIHPGDHLVLPIAGVTPRVFVAGIWRDYGRQQGSIVIDSDTYTRLTGDARRSIASVALKKGALADAVITRLRAVLPAGVADHLSVSRSQEIRSKGIAAFDRSFAITYLLEAIPILVGLIGVAATVSAQTLARIKEFGMLRHIGVLRRQIVAMLIAEGALLGAIGGIAGIGLGLAMSQILIRVVNPQSFHWTMDTRIPWLLFAIVIVALIIAAGGTALFAGRRALSTAAVTAVREDW
jgi:putative ABC transport system permease protein